MFDKDNGALEALEGPVQFAHQFVNMTDYSVDVLDPVDGLISVRTNIYLLISMCVSLFR